MPPAARITDITAHGSPMLPGPGSSNVMIGFLPAWRAMSPAAVAAFVALIAKIMVNVNKLATALTSSNAPVAAEATKALSDQIPEALNMIASMDTIVCPTLLIGIGGPPHGPGVVIGGSTTVMINNLPAARVGDTIQETMSVNTVVAGCFTVIIGG